MLLYENDSDRWKNDRVYIPKDILFTCYNY